MQQLNNKGILFIGGPADALPGIARAKALGYRVFVTDGNPEAPALKWAKKYADGWGVADIYDFAETIKVAKQWQFDGCLSIGCDIGPVVSLVAKYFGLPHVSYHVAKLSWDKPSLKKVLSDAGISTPRTAEIVIKPPDGRGSRGVSVVSASNLWGAEWAEAKANSPTGRVMCEEYIYGEGVSIEAIIWQGETVFWGACNRTYGVSKTVEIGGDAPYLGREWPWTLCQRVVEAISMKGSGTIKLDVILRDGDARYPYVIEAAIGRLSGGLMCSHYLPLSSGADFLKMAFRVYCGQPPDPWDALWMLKTKHIPGRFPYYVVGRYEMPSNPSRNGDRGRFRLRLGRSREEAERKLCEPLSIKR